MSVAVMGHPCVKCRRESTQSLEEVENNVPCERCKEKARPKLPPPVPPVPGKGLVLLDEPGLSGSLVLSVGGIFVKLYRLICSWCIYPWFKFSQKILEQYVGLCTILFTSPGHAAGCSKANL